MKFVFIDPKGIWNGLNNGIAYMAALLKKEGHQVHVIDFVNKQGNEEKRMESVKGADYVGISLKSFTLEDGLRLARLAKKMDPSIKLIAGGPHTTIDGENLLRENDIFDFAIYGEGEEAVIDIASGKPLNEIQGLYYRNNGQIIKTEARQWLLNLDDVPFPDYDNFDSLEGKIKSWPLTSSRGCPYSCTYCFTPDTFVHSDSGFIPIKNFYDYYENPKVVMTSDGFQKVTHFFERMYKGKIIKIKASKLPAIQSTPNHKFRIMRNGKVGFYRADQIKENDFLEMPLPAQEEMIFIDVEREIGNAALEYIYSRKVPLEAIEKAIELHEKGMSTRKIAAITNLSKSFVHYISQNRIEKKKIIKNNIVNIDDTINFRLSRSVSIPSKIHITKDLCRLIGYYLAEGCVTKSKSRRNNYTISWTFSIDEKEYAEDVKRILHDSFDIDVHETIQGNVRRVYISSSILGLLFGNMFGKGARNKRIPQHFLSLNNELITQLMIGWLRGDGGIVKLNDRKGNMVKATTTSISLAYQFFMLSYKIGLAPSLQKNKTSKSFINGREIKGCEFNYHLNFKIKADVSKLLPIVFSVPCEKYEKTKFSHIKENYSLFFPVKFVEELDFEGIVYNLEVEKVHNYTANGFLVSNCSVPVVIGRKFRTRSPKNIVDELFYAKEKYGAEDFKVLDDNFTLLMDHAEAICDEIMNRDLGMKWSCPNGIRADRLNPGLLKKMKEAGCYAISIGVESGDPEVFDNIRKGEHLVDVERGIKMAKEAGLEVHGFFILGLIGSSYESDKRSMEFAKRVGLDSASWGILVPYPGTEVWEQVKKAAAKNEATMLRDWKEGFHIGVKQKPVFETPSYTSEERVKAYYMANIKFMKKRDIPKAAKMVLKSFIKK